LNPPKYEGKEIFIKKFLGPCIEPRELVELISEGIRYYKITINFVLPNVYAMSPYVVYPAEARGQIPFYDDVYTARAYAREVFPHMDGGVISG
jgi:hypothetical protein